ncbi:MAG: DUF2627 domain-containing protein [Candidatus Cohnella colombiensis]|uniref:DUF2627 domain-containing protein n=1 Tax=Candidatus Cohnella colombiensis TaxID=3121368 RepID=A0AA95F134_9BACL|nr:MAG: DUF2627 domain-containing protein [Cohnella sp.]
MKLTIQRLIAVLLLVIPGIGATYGFLLMKDAFFNYFAYSANSELKLDFEWGMFVLGAILFLCGIGFIGGWTFYRDRKRNYLSSRFRPKRTRPVTKSQTENKAEE